MQRRDSRLLLSATDLVNFHECEHLSALDRAALDDEALKAQRTKPDDQAELLFRKGREFEASYLEELKRLHPGAVTSVSSRQGITRTFKCARRTCVISGLLPSSAVCPGQTEDTGQLSSATGPYVLSPPPFFFCVASMNARYTRYDFTHTRSNRARYGNTSACCRNPAAGRRATQGTRG